MKKIISLLGAMCLIGASGGTVLACQNNGHINEDPDYQVLKEKPATMDEVIEIVGPYWDLFVFYRDTYYEKDWPKGIAQIDSENWQRAQIYHFSSDYAIPAYAYLGLGYTENIAFITPAGNKYNIRRITPEPDCLINMYQNYMKNNWLNQKTKEVITRWYNWALE